MLLNKKSFSQTFMLLLRMNCNNVDDLFTFHITTLTLFKDGGQVSSPKVKKGKRGKLNNFIPISVSGGLKWKFVARPMCVTSAYAQWAQQYGSYAEDVDNFISRKLIFFGQMCH